MSSLKKSWFRERGKGIRTCFTLGELMVMDVRKLQSGLDNKNIDEMLENKIVALKDSKGRLAVLYVDTRYPNLFKEKYEGSKKTRSLGQQVYSCE
jgi:hypothetical protein